MKNEIKKDQNLFKNAENSAVHESGSRRRFLKKAAYSTPGLFALGQLARPTKGMADSKNAVGTDPRLGHPPDFWNQP